MQRASLVCTALLLAGTGVSEVPSHPFSGSPASILQASSTVDAAQLEATGDFRAAAEAWRAAAQKAPSTDALPYAHLGFCLARLGDYTQAVAAYQTARTRNHALPGWR